MKHKKLNLCAVLLLGLGLSEIQAQETLPSSGGKALGGGGEVNFTVGQVVYTTIIGTNGTVAQGVQQPFEISVTTGIEQAKGITLSLTAYPNPTTEFVILKVESFKIENLSYQLINMSGQLLETKKIESNETNISMINFVPATYFLKVTNCNKQVKLFKIIKN
ncbi:MAG: T9SS type A sorting domain-containing protein [Paludibacter sp.]|jgi:Secretion system C-terminal sorting domain